LKTRNLLFLGLGGVAAWYLWTRVQLGQKTKLIFKKIRLIGKGLSKQLELNFKIQNPTNQTGVVSAITGEVYVNDRIVADFSSFGEQKIAPKSESDFKVIATPTIGIIQLLTQRGLLKSGLKYKIKGTGNFDGIVAPFEYTAKLV
jgi:hypothetical protein